MLRDSLLGTDEWVAEVRRLLIALRVRSMKSLLDLDVPGIFWTGVYKLETGRRPQLLLEQILVLCRYYDANPVLLLGASDGVLESSWPMTRKSSRSVARSDVPEVEVLDRMVRRRLRRWRKGLHGPDRTSTDPFAKQAVTGYRALAADSGVAPRWLMRVESGEQRSLDLIRIHRVLRCLGRTMSDLIDHRNDDALEVQDGNRDATG